jgi:hypothetical protein
LSSSRRSFSPIQIAHDSVCIASARPLTAKIRISAAQFQPY